MRAEFFRPDRPDEVIGVAEWDGAAARVGADDEGVRGALSRVFRASPVAVDDPSRRALGTSGPVVVEPGDLDWFLTAATVRGEEEGLSVRFSTDSPGGWDPAGAYRGLGDWVGRQEPDPRTRRSTG